MARGHRHALLRGLFLTGLLADEFFADSNYFGAASAVLLSASSKTAIGFPAEGGAVVIDMSGDSAVLAVIHDHFGDRRSHSMLVDFVRRSERWLTVERSTGPEAAQATDRDVLDGAIPPSIGRVVSLHD